MTLVLALLTAAALLTVASFSASPAQAQFGSIFSDSPPRPPEDVPTDNRLPPPTNLAPSGQPYYPSRNDNNVQPRDYRAGQPPQRQPSDSGIQSQSLPPPPGVVAAPPRQPPVQNQQQLGTATPGAGQPGTLPGLPPGVRQPSATPQQATPQQATTPQQPAIPAPPPNQEVVVEPPPQRIANPTAVFSGLDKITGRIISFDVAINETVQFGALQVTPKVCYSRPPTETPNTDAFVQVDEVTLAGEIKRIFSGWMFAASPGLHAVEHPIYDVWLTDCKGEQNPNVADAGSSSGAAPKIAVKLPRPRPRIPSLASPAVRP